MGNNHNILCCDQTITGARGVVVSTLTTHASGPGSIPVAGGQKERLISLLLNLVARIPRKVEVPSTLTLRVEVK